MKKIIIGNNKSPVLAYENALLLYVYGRATYQTDSFLWLLPSIIHLFHHSIEISIKMLLKLKNIKYPYGQAGHKTYSLLRMAVSSNFFSKSVNSLLHNKDLIELLKTMDDNYLDNKYEYPGYMINMPLCDFVDEIIIILFEEINSILKSRKHALAVLYMPEFVEKMFLHKLSKLFPYTLLTPR